MHGNIWKKAMSTSGRIHDEKEEQVEGGERSHEFTKKTRLSVNNYGQMNSLNCDRYEVRGILLTHFYTKL